jgi:hypothetical protein
VYSKIWMVSSRQRTSPGSMELPGAVPKTMPPMMLDVVRIIFGCPSGPMRTSCAWSPCTPDKRNVFAVSACRDPLRTVAISAIVSGRSASTSARGEGAWLSSAGKTTRSAFIKLDSGEDRLKPSRAPLRQVALDYPVVSASPYMLRIGFHHERPASWIWLRRREEDDRRSRLTMYTQLA